MKHYKTIKVKEKEFWWRVYGYNGGRKLEIIFTPEKFPEYEGVTHDLSFWNYPPSEIIGMVKTDCVAYLNGEWEEWMPTIEGK